MVSGSGRAKCSSSGLTGGRAVLFRDLVTDFFNGGDEPIAFARQRFDDLRFAVIILQSFANLLDGRIDGMLELDESVFSPQRLLNISARDQFAGAARQQSQQLCRLVLQSNPLIVFSEFAGPDVQVK